MANAGIRLEIDASDLKEEINRLRSVATPEQFDRAMYRIFLRTGGRVRKIVKQDLPKQYHVKQKDVASDIQGTKITSGGVGGVGCIIPIRGTRRAIGNKKGYSATGYKKGWNSVKGKYKIKAKIVKSGESVLPANVSSYGGQPPFRNNTARKLNMLTFTREGKARLPIKPVKGIAIPQMPLNRSKPDVQKDIMDHMRKRIEHEFQLLMGSGR